MKGRYEIKWNRLLVALVVTVLIADTAPHPNLAPGLLQSALETWQNQSGRAEASSLSHN